MLAMQSRCKCITAWLQTKEMAFIVHTTVGSCSKAILIVDGVPTGLLFQDYFCFNMLKSNNLQYDTLGPWFVWTKDVLTQGSDVPSIIFVYNFLQNSFQKSFQLFFSIFL